MKTLILIALIFAADIPVGEYRSPGPNDIRGPCPGLNALANHGFLHRDGRRITAWEINEAMRTAFGFGHSLNYFQMFGASIRGVERFHEGLGWGIDSLADLTNSHNELEHDSSFTRDDYYFNKDVATINQTLVNQFLSFSSDGKVLTRMDIARARKARIDDSVARNPQVNHEKKLMDGMFRENSLIQLLLGEPVRVDYARIFLSQDKLPYELGWKPRKKNDLLDLATHLSQAKEFENLHKQLQ
jgi:hypothetical protein